MAETGHTAFIGLGSNLDNPREQVRRAMAELASVPHTRGHRQSSLYQTDPVGYRDQPAFINAVAKVETTLDPEALLLQLRQIESAHGRSRGMPNGPRTLDLDLLLYDDWVLDSPSLVLPHPRMHGRAFVLVPLAELDAEVRIPGIGTVKDALAALDQTGVSKLP
ncbi:MAG: 2-amino-4-hydroxy-6-hydroxymethyldihydropteridine diphosphokinase [Burkholderiales bacterium]|nr:2-amino-4-hydroxy-6-hydroxymethyldihydropteridine diphosphokinase [Burkholderiales bacterium]